LDHGHVHQATTASTLSLETVDTERWLQLVACVGLPPTGHDVAFYGLHHACHSTARRNHYQSKKGNGYQHSRTDKAKHSSANNSYLTGCSTKTFCKIIHIHMLSHMIKSYCQSTCTASPHIHMYTCLYTMKRSTSFSCYMRKMFSFYSKQMSF